MEKYRERIFGGLVENEDCALGGKFIDPQLSRQCEAVSTAKPEEGLVEMQQTAVRFSFAEGVIQF